MALLLLFSTVTASAVVTTTREWLAHRAEPAPLTPPGPTTLDEARKQARTEPDRLLAAGPYPAARAHELYGGSSGIVRGYGAAVESRWRHEPASY